MNKREPEVMLCGCHRCHECQGTGVTQIAHRLDNDHKCDKCSGTGTGTGTGKIKLCKVHAIEEGLIKS